MLTTVILGLVVLALVLIILEDIVHVNKAKTTLFFEPYVGYWRLFSL
jgi:hypothetical protein